jgi:hypothetical protein
MTNRYYPIFDEEVIPNKRRGLVLASTYNKLLNRFISLLSLKRDETLKTNQMIKLYNERNEVSKKLGMYYDIGNLFDYLVQDGHDLHFEELMFNLTEQMDLEMYKNLKEISFLMEFNREKEARSNKYF